MASREATLREAAVQEGAARAPPVITVVPGGHDAVLREAVAQEATRAQETAVQEGAARAPPVITVVPGVQEVAS